MGEGGDGFAGAGAGGPPEVDAGGFAGGAGDRGGAAFAGGLLGGGGPVQDGADFGEQLGEVDGADAGQAGQEAGAGVGGDPCGDEVLDGGDGGLQAAQWAAPRFPDS